MLTQAQVDKFIEDTEKQIQAIDREFEQTKSLIAENQDAFKLNDEVKAKAQSLLADAKTKAERAGRERVFDAQEAVPPVGKPRRSRGLAI